MRQRVVVFIMIIFLKNDSKMAGFGGSLGGPWGIRNASRQFNFELLKPFRLKIPKTAKNDPQNDSQEAPQRSPNLLQKGPKRAPRGSQEGPKRFPRAVQEESGNIEKTLKKQLFLNYFHRFLRVQGMKIW